MIKKLNIAAFIMAGIPLNVIASNNVLPESYELSIQAPKPASLECSNEIQKETLNQFHLLRRNLKDDESPFGYVHQTVPQQIKFYREIYDIEIKKYRGNTDALLAHPIAGLSTVLENAFALVSDFIREQKSFNAAGKDEYRQVLNILWQKAKNLEGQLTCHLFKQFNRCIAEIVDEYKINNMDTDKLRQLNPLTYRNAYNPRVNPYPDPIWFIIYSNPNFLVEKRGILPSHFVEQYCTGHYRAYIAQFDVLSSQKEKPSRQDPHWSVENGTLRLLDHDFGHVTFGPVVQSERAFKVIKSGYEIQQAYERSGLLNEAKILMSGLYIIFHEKANTLDFDNWVMTINQFFTPRNLDSLSEMCYNDIDFRRPAYEHYGTKYYKQEYRDWEYILKGYYVDKSNDNILKVVHDEEGRPFLPVEYSPDLKKTTRPFPNLQKDERDIEMKKALKGGYARFWNYFVQLIKNRRQIN